MKRIEFTGVANSGKSFILQRLVEVLKGKSFQTVPELKAHALSRRLLHGYPILTLVIEHELTKTRAGKSYLNNKFLEEGYSSGFWEMAELDDLVNHVFSSSSYLGQASSVRRIHKFLNSACELSALQGYGWAGLLIMDEGVIHRGHSLSVFSEEPEEFACRYFSLCPVPTGIVIVSADTKTLSQRRKHRDGKVWSCREREVFQTAVKVEKVMNDTLAKRGGCVLSIDGAGDVAENVRQISTFVESL